MLSDDLGGRGGDGGRREAPEGEDTGRLMADSCCQNIQQKPAQHCKAIFLRLKINFKKEEEILLQGYGCFFISRQLLINCIILSS